MAKMKGKNFMILIAHAGIWTGCIALAGFLIGYSVDLYDVALLFFVHAIADYAKASGKPPYHKMDVLKGGLVLDQSIHVVQIIVFMAMNGGL